MNHPYDEGRRFITDADRLETDFTKSDQMQGIPMPLPCRDYQRPVDIPLPEPTSLSTDWVQLCKNRASLRQYADTPISLPMLSSILWAAQGMRESVDNHYLRHVPSAGNRHPLETYIFVRHVESLEPGLYRYHPLSHGLIHLSEAVVDGELNNALLKQRFALDAAFVLAFTAVPYRTEWRYLNTAHRVILLDAGHAMHAAIMTGEAMGLGACPIAAYHQELMDKLLHVDPTEEMTIYVASFGMKPYDAVRLS